MGVSSSENPRQGGATTLKAGSGLLVRDYLIDLTEVNLLFCSFH
jgi:hypothetical protein